MPLKKNWQVKFGMDLLKKEIERKRKAKETQGKIQGPKWRRRGDIEKEREEAYRQQYPEPAMASPIKKETCTTSSSPPKETEAVKILPRKPMPFYEALDFDDPTLVPHLCVLHFIQYTLQQWQDEGTNLDTFRQTERYLQPLLVELTHNTLSETVLTSLHGIVKHLIAKAYAEANTAYLALAIGNAPWPIGVANTGIHERRARDKIQQGHASHLLDDETRRRYLQVSVIP